MFSQHPTRNRCNSHSLGNLPYMVKVKARLTLSQERLKKKIDLSHTVKVDLKTKREN